MVGNPKVAERHCDKDENDDDDDNDDDYVSHNICFLLHSVVLYF